MFTTINRKYPYSGIHGRVVHELGREIVSGVIKPGEKLPHESIVIERFNGSRTAIREAFRVLTAKGLLEARQRAGTHVRARKFWNVWDPDIISWQDFDHLPDVAIENLLDVRRLIEPEAARLLTMQDNNEEILASLLQICRNMEKVNQSGDYYRLLELEHDFHVALMEGCGNEYFQAMSEVVSLLVKKAQSYQIRQSPEKISNVRWYLSVLEKIRHGDSGDAFSAVKSLVIRDQEIINGQPSAEENAVA
jgi:GntR family transcriptional regulator, galactonate operon transcriptional repressor